jgi:hypothetical protein
MSNQIFIDQYFSRDFSPLIHTISRASSYVNRRLYPNSFFDSGSLTEPVLEGVWMKIKNLIDLSGHEKIQILDAAICQFRFWWAKGYGGSTLISNKLYCNMGRMVVQNEHRF